MARIQQLNLRLSAVEFLLLSAAAASAGLTPTAWVRHAALRTAASAPEPPERFQPPPPETPPAKLLRTASTRFTEAQFQALVGHAHACGVTVTAFIRLTVLGVKPIARRPEIRDAIVAVNRIGNNLNQLTKLANSGVIAAPDLILILHQVVAEFHALQAAILRADKEGAPEAP